LTDKQKAWAVMMVTFLAGIITAINSFKVPPLIRVLMNELHVSMVAGGWLMSVSSATSLMLAIPAAFLLVRLGPKITGLIALSCTIIGSAIGAMAPNAAVMLLGRVIEGISLGLLSVTAPTVISMWFRPKELGLPMGLWTAWVPIGNVIMFNIAHPLLASFGWRAIWWFGALLAFLAFVLFGLVVTVPQTATRRERKPASSVGMRLFNPPSWCLALAFATFSFSLIGYNSWAPTFLSDALHIEAATASFYASLMFLAAIPANVIAGWVLGHLKNRYALLPASFLLMSFLIFWGFRLANVNMVAPYMIALGFISNFIPTAALAFAPETMPGPELAGLAVAILTVGANTGSLTGPPVLGAIFSQNHWSAGSTSLTIVAGIGTIVSWLVAKRLGAVHDSTR
jgi:MFS family permease